MKNVNKKGFTLIELLVVVLIIGILASVALPQYQKAVDKSRVSRYLPVLKTIYNAQKLYYMANGTYATKLEDLDVSLPCISARSTTTSCAVDDRTKIETSSDLSELSFFQYSGFRGQGLYIRYWHDDGIKGLAGTLYGCVSLQEWGQSICKSLGGKQVEAYPQIYALDN